MDRYLSHIQDFQECIRRIVMIVRCPSFPKMPENHIYIFPKLRGFQQCWFSKMVLFLLELSEVKLCLQSLKELIWGVMDTSAIFGAPGNPYLCIRQWKSGKTWGFGVSGVLWPFSFQVLKKNNSMELLGYPVFRICGKDGPAPSDPKLEFFYRAPIEPLHRFFRFTNQCSVRDCQRAPSWWNSVFVYDLPGFPMVFMVGKSWENVGNRPGIVGLFLW